MKKLLAIFLILILLIVTSIISTLLFLSEKDNNKLTLKNDELSEELENIDLDGIDQEDNSEALSNLSLNLPGFEGSTKFSSKWNFSYKVNTSTELGIGTFEIEEPVTIKLNDNTDEFINDNNVNFSGFSFKLKNDDAQLNGALNTIPNQIFLELDTKNSSVVKVKDELYRIKKADKWMYITSLNNCADVEPCYSENFAYISDGGIAMSLNFSGDEGQLEEIDDFVSNLLGY
jgi:hypothetical protein